MSAEAPRAASALEAGFRLFVRALPRLVAFTAPLAAMGALLVVFVGGSVDGIADDEAPLGAADAVAFALGVYGVALVGVLLSEEHTGEELPNPYLFTLRRIPVWLATWVLVVLLVIVGFVLLIVPGVLASLRLFYADELALMHGMGPLRAVAASDGLTRGMAMRLLGFQWLLGIAEYAALVPAFLLFLLVDRAVDATPLGASAVGELLLAYVFAQLGLLVYAAWHAPELAWFYRLVAHRGAEAATGEPPERAPGTPAALR